MQVLRAPLAGAAAPPHGCRQSCATNTHVPRSASCTAAWLMRQQHRQVRGYQAAARCALQAVGSTYSVPASTTKGNSSASSSSSTTEGAATIAGFRGLCQQAGGGGGGLRHRVQQVRRHKALTWKAHTRGRRGAIDTGGQNRAGRQRWGVPGNAAAIGL